MHTNPARRDDAGFSFAQVIVTMVIVGILGAAIGFTAFQFIGESRNTVLASNTRVAAEALQNTLALKPHLMDDVDTTTGALDAALLSELSNVAGFTWLNGTANTVPEDADDPGWQLHSDDTVETVRVQAILDGTATGASNAVPPTVSWLVGNGDAVRLHIRNQEGAWACALIVLRPNWTAGTEDAQAEAALRGVWYGSGVDIAEDAAGNTDDHKETGGKHHCSPATVTAVTVAAVFGHGVSVNDPLPANAATWQIPADDDGSGRAADQEIAARSLRRTVPPIGEG